MEFKSLLNQLGDEMLKKEDGLAITRQSKSGKISAIVYYYPPEVIAAVPVSKGSHDIAEKTLATGSPKPFKIELTNLKPNAMFEIEILDQEHGFAFKDWQRMGSPEPPTREQTKELKNKAMEMKKLQVSAGSNGTLNWETTLSPWSAVLVKEV
jgi:xylan 1,4-beta-xylosidase